MRTRSRIATAFLLSLTLSACGLPGLGGGGTSPPTPSVNAPSVNAPSVSAPSVSAPSVSAPSANPDAPGDQDPQATATTSEPSRAPAKALAKTTFGSGATLSADVAVLGLRRRGKLLDLVLSFTPHSKKGDTYISIEEWTGAGPAVITLVDSVNLKRYLVVRDSKDQPLQPPDWILKVDEPATRTYTFPAPDASVTALDVSIGGWPPFRDILVTP
jgi:hypothetical protein